jgi:hypothetical protein
VQIQITPEKTALSAFAVAACAGFIGEITLLVNAGADLTTVHPPLDKTAVELATMNGHHEAAQHLQSLMA